MSEFIELFQIKYLYLAIFLISFIFTLLCFMVPLCESSGSIHKETLHMAWEGSDSPEMYRISRILYDFGDVMCHQHPKRSWFINQNQMPLCIRCMGICFGMVFIFGITWKITPFDTFLGTLCKLFGLPETVRYKRVLIFLLLCLLSLPMLVDGFSQIIFEYESNAYLRLITGFLYGIAQGAVIIGLVSVFFREVKN